MIIIQQHEDDEENEQSSRSVDPTQGKEDCMDKIKEYLFHKIPISTLFLLLLIAAFLSLGYKYMTLSVTLEQHRETSDQLMVIQTTITNYQPSQYLIPNTKILTQDKVTLSEGLKLQRMLAYYLMPFTDTDCELRRYGAKNDGGYLICQNLLQQTHTLLNFGIDNEDQFGCQLIQLHPKIKNHQFDCTKKIVKKCTKNGEAMFMDVCLSNKDAIVNEWKYSKLDTIMQKFKIIPNHMVVKMDIQGSQWSSLSTIPLSLFDKIDQLIIQFHLNKPQNSLSWHYLGIIKSLSSKYIPVNLHMNNYGCFGLFQQLHHLRSDSFEVTFVNRNTIKMNTYARSFNKNALNRPNNPAQGDCQLS